MPSFGAGGGRHIRELRLFIEVWRKSNGTLWLLCHFQCILVTMTDFTEFEQLLAYKQDVLGEIVREGELKLSSQLSVATAADSRALALIGFQIAAATASLGGTVALLFVTPLREYLIALGFFAALGLIVAAFIAIESVRPANFSFPGNQPENWLPNQWISNAALPGDKSLERARIEQCFVLNNAINRNATDMLTNANKVKLSIDITFWTIAMAALFLGGYWTWQAFALVK